MMVPQPTAQYGQVERVSLARVILSTRSWAKAGCKSTPKTAAAAPPTVVSFRKSRRDGFTENPLSARSKEGESSRTDIHKALVRKCQAVIWVWPCAFASVAGWDAEVEFCENVAYPLQYRLPGHVS